MQDFDDPEKRIRRIMREAVPDTSNIADFAAAARKRGRPVAKTAPVLKISGSNNAGIIGNNNQVNITVRTAARPKIMVAPGSDAIDNAQAAEIKRLVAKVVEVSGRSYGHVYGTLYRRFDATSYLLIKRNRYDAVVRYLNKWIASTAPVPTGSAEDERKRLLKRIHAQARKRHGIEAIRAYARGRFGTPSLAELSPGQLAEIIRQHGF